MSMIINPNPTKSNLGGKGYHLHKMKNDFSIPEFFVMKFENENEVSTSDIQKEILEAFDSHKFEYVSVRSSATVEDSDIAAFAGIFETYLYVTRDILVDSITKVIESAKSDRAVDYCIMNGIDVSNIEMRVVVQQMIDCRVSGVCFSKDVSNPEEMIINACFGAGDALVSGKISPDEYKINRTTKEITSKKIEYQKWMNAPFRCGEYIEVPVYKRYVKKLKDQELMELAERCLEIEAKLGFDIADIEWTYNKNQLYILQARPFVGKI